MTPSTESAASCAAHAEFEPSIWIQRWSHLVAAGGPVLDLACGTGRHMRWFSQRGHPVLGIDRAPDALAAAAAFGEVLLADLERDPWPLERAGETAGPRRFCAVVVTNYLWRPLMARVIESIAEGGLLLYETFSVAQASIGRPSRPEFLLQSGELLRACQGLHVVAYEDGLLTDPERFVQRIAAVRAEPGASHPRRDLLDPPPIDRPLSEQTDDLARVRSAPALR